jgi:aminoglycoside phosphotransferase (APT) family kinase protein
VAIDADQAGSTAISDRFVGFLRGDARIGNVMYDDDANVLAVLDWEMVGVGPPELDLAWMVHAHRAFEDIAATYGFPGMPHLLRRDDVLATYERVSGRAPRSFDWFFGYAAVQWGIVGLRTGRRAAHFGEREMPEDVDELVMNREPLERLLAGAYWD